MKSIKFLFRVLILLSIFILSAWALVARPVYVTTVNDETNDFVDIDRLEKVVKHLSLEFFPRDYTQVENTQAVASYLETELSKSTDSIEIQEFEVKGVVYKNIVASFGPDTKEIYVVGAHYDAVSTTPGADDNASGIAGILELARLISKQALKHKILIVAYALEEPPHFSSPQMGSYIHAVSLEGKDVKLMVSLEMIGYFTNEPNTQDYPMPLLNILYPDSGNFIAVVEQFSNNNAWKLKAAINQYTELSAYSLNAPEYIAAIGFSDQRNYWKYGYPAVMITDTAFFRNHEYHKQGDTYDRLNYNNMAKVVYGLYKYLMSLQ